MCHALPIRKFTTATHSNTSSNTTIVPATHPSSSSSSFQVFQ